MFLFTSIHHFQSLFLEKSIGNAQAGIYLGELDKLYIPLPPIREQNRIVSEIKRWFTLIDEIEQGKADLQTTIKQTKSKILDLTMNSKVKDFALGLLDDGL